MTHTHLHSVAVTTAYISVAIQLEERDPDDVHPEYAVYRRRVPMLVPAWRPRPIRTDAARHASSVAGPS